MLLFRWSSSRIRRSADRESADPKRSPSLPITQEQVQEAIVIVQRHVVRGGQERRRTEERRASEERRDGWLRVGRWRSVPIFDT